MAKTSANEAADLQRQTLRKEGGQWLKTMRESCNMSQRELAEKIDVGYYTFVSQIEAGRGRIPAERYQVWADALGMNAREFVRDLMKFYEPSTYDILFGNEAA
ncbi:helix-turn-helix domain-containing protein [Roseibium limicola]|uniref:Helix-turn-helix transcriptional regulator n=1 Tax=Roseibium limicola TaxID=2816037 RepID=A0A939JAV4_9HYPH|nr:helix-turn-helix transcriptional regulator [Roseibium limicola]MBO0346808.1 helix-turn-helix transcriptional regulator [Roseibium limicola]